MRDQVQLRVLGIWAAVAAAACAAGFLAAKYVHDSTPQQLPARVAGPTALATIRRPASIGNLADISTATTVPLTITATPTATSPSFPTGTQTSTPTTQPTTGRTIFPGG